MAEAMAEAGHDPAHLGPDPETLRRIGTFVELHVEQGRGPGRPRPTGRRRRRRSGRTAGGGSTCAGEANHAGTTRLEDRHDPMLALAAAVLAARVAARAHGCVATVGKVAVEPGGVNAIPSPGHRVARRPRRRSTATCARSSPSVGAQAGVEPARGVVDPETAFDAALAARPRPGCSTRRRCCPPAPGTTPASSPPRGSRPRCCSSATRPGSRTHPTSTPSRTTATAGVEALTRGRPRAGRMSARLRPALARRARAAAVGARARRPARGGRRAVHRRDARQPAAGDAERLPGVVLPGLANAPQPRLPPRAARPHPRRRRHLLDLARADVRRRRAARPGHLPRAGPRRPTPRWRWPASPAWASSTTCTTPPGGTRVRRPERDGRGAAPGGRARPASGYPAGHLLPRRRARRRRARAAGRAAAALRRRHGRALGRAAGARCADVATRDAASVRRSTRCGRCRATSIGVVVGPPRATAAARAPVRAAGRERRVPRRSTAARPTELLARRRARSGRGPRRCTPPT